MKEIFKMGASLFGKLIVINILCFFLTISMSVLTTAVFSKEVGYTVFVTDAETNEIVTQYEHYYEDGDDTKEAEYQGEEYKITKSVIKSNVSKGADVTFYTVTQILCLIMLVIFIYPNLWDRGTRDSNLVSFGHAEKDIFKGLKVGFLAIIPSLLMMLFFIFTKSNISAKFPVGILKFLNSSMYSINYLICGMTMALKDLSVWQLLLMTATFLFVPAVCQGAYFLGYKNISIGEKIVYKKTKN